MLLAVEVSGVQASLLQSGLNSLLYLLSLGLLNSYGDLLLLHLLRNTRLVDGQRVHSGDLHHYVVSSLLRCLVESGDRAELVLVHVVVNRSERTLNDIVAIELHLLTRDTAAIRNRILYRTIAHRQSLHLIQCLALVRYGSVEDSLCQSDEISVLRNEVCLALQGDDSSEATILLCQHATLRSITIRTLSGDRLSLLTDNLHCLVDVALSLGQRLFAIHHTSSAQFAQLGYISQCNSHNFLFYLKC